MDRQPSRRSRPGGEAGRVLGITILPRDELVSRFHVRCRPLQRLRREAAVQALCGEFRLVRSRGAVGTSADNAAAESFNAGLKRETLKGAKRWPGARAARLDVFRWLTLAA